MVRRGHIETNAGERCVVLNSACSNFLYANMGVLFVDDIYLENAWGKFD